MRVVSVDVWNLSATVRASVLACVAILLLSVVGTSAASASSVTTYHNDNARTGTNAAETILTPGNVTVNQFGKLFSYAVDGDVYAQPLYLPNVTVGTKGVHNVLYVATEYDSVYAFDADSNSGANASPLWHTSFINPGAGITPVSSTDASCSDISPYIGITGTPVIDPSSGTLYVVANTKENGKFLQRLHALDVSSGAEKFGGPVVIQATVSGTGQGSSAGKVNFDPLRENQRPGLLLANGVVYISWASHCDNEPYHGWVVAYNATTLVRAGFWNSTPNGGAGGVWQSGGALAADSANHVYFATGNGDFDANTGGADFGDSILKLSPSIGGSPADYFTPYDEASLNASDGDLGSGGVVLLPTQPTGSPHQNLLVQAGKEGTIYLVNRDNMGKFNASSNDQIVQSVTGAIGTVFCTPAWWNNTVYFGAINDVLKEFVFNPSTGLFNTSPHSQAVPSFGFPGATPSISANGNTNAILWAIQTDAFKTGGSAVLHAFDATNLSNELYNSSHNLARDNPGLAVIFAVPTVTNGKVYVGTRKQVSVYGLLPPPPAGINFVQVAAATPQTSSSTVSIEYPLAQTNGDLNVVVVGWNDTTSTVSSVADNRGNTYVLAVGPTTASGARQSIYYAKNIAGGSTTVTVSFNPAAASVDVRVLEYAGLDTTSPLDVTAAAVGSSTTASSGSATTTAANELIFGADTIATGTPGPGAGFTTRIITSPDSDIAEDKIVSLTGSYSATAPVSPSGYWVMQMATFKAPGSGGTPAPTVSSVSPNSGSTNGGTAVTIAGSNFAAGATVTFGGTAATNVNVVSSTSITASTPAHAAGTVNVVVTNTGGQSGTLSSGFTYTSSTSTPISFVQVAAATPQTASSTVSVPYKVAQTAGDLNIVVVGWNDTTSSVNSLTDTLGNTYSLAVGPTTASGARQSIYYAKNIKGGSNTVTVAFNQAAVAVDLRVLEYKGLSQTSPLDVTAAAVGSSTTASSGSATTTSANELIFGADTIATGTPGPGTGFTTRIITSPDSDIAEDKIVSATGAYSATAPVSPSGYWVMQMATFRQ